MVVKSFKLQNLTNILKLHDLNFLRHNITNCFYDNLPRWLLLSYCLEATAHIFYSQIVHRDTNSPTTVHQMGTSLTFSRGYTHLSESLLIFFLFSFFYTIEVSYFLSRTTSVLFILSSTKTLLSRLCPFFPVSSNFRSNRAHPEIKQKKQKPCWLFSSVFYF